MIMGGNVTGSKVTRSKEIEEIGRNRGQSVFFGKVYFDPYF